MNRLNLPNYNLDATLFGGQSFAWEKARENYYGFLQGKVIHFKLGNQDPLATKIHWQTYPQKDNFDLISEYFRLDDDYENIIRKISKDNYMVSAIDQLPGLRLLQQGFEHAALSFIISSNNSVKSIKTRINKMRIGLGDTVLVDGVNQYAFPRAEVIADTDMNTLMGFGLGYRAKYLKSSAKLIVNEPDKFSFKNSEHYSVAKSKLLDLPGVGNKVADCILVFGLGYNEVTPIDLWADRILTGIYNLEATLSYEDKHAWFNEYFEGHAAFAGQFLFEWVRKNPHVLNTNNRI